MNQALEPPVTSEPAPPPGTSLSHRTARSFAWMAAQSVIIKIINFIGQIALAWLLVPEDFGLVAIAYMISILPVLIQQGGLKEVLIHRAHFTRWSSPAVWMSATLGVAGGALMAAAAYPVAHWYNEPRLAALVLIIAALFPIESAATVPLARMHSEMRFRLISFIYLAQGASQMGLSVLFAWMGLGPLSIILPRPIISLCTAIGCWLIAPVHVAARPQVRRWRFLVGDSARVLITNACWLLLTYLAYLALSVFYGATEVGLYYFAYNLSLQALVLLGQHLSSVLFPALATLQHEPARQTQAALRALHVLACVAFPACLLQAVIAEPGIHAVFAPRWYSSVILVQLLSVAMLARCVEWPTFSLLQAQGRFASQMKLAIFSVILHAIIVSVGAWQYGTVGVAIGVVIHALIIAPVVLHVAVRRGGFGWADLIFALWRPLMLSLLVAGAAGGAGMMVPNWPYREWWQCGAIVLVAGLVYLPLLRLLAPAAWDEMKARYRALRG